MSPDLRRCFVALVLPSIFATACGLAGVHKPGPASGAGGTSSPGGTGGGQGVGGSTTDARNPTADAAPPGVDAPSATCAEEAFQAEIMPLDLLLVVDTSSSMLFPSGPMGTGTQLKWEVMAKSLISFVRDPRSAGLGVGLVFFPLNKTCAADADCPAIEGIFGPVRTCQHRTVCWGPRA